MGFNFIFSIVAVVLGILCAIFTDFSIKIVVIALGASAIVKGIFDLVKNGKLIPEDSVFHKTIAIRSAVSILIGLVAVALPMAFFNAAETVVHIMLYVLGVYFLFSAIGGFLIVRRLKEANLSTKVGTSETIASLLIAVVLFLLASIGVKNMLRIAGVVVACIGAVGIVYSVLKNPKPQEIKPDSVEEVPGEPLEADVVTENLSDTEQKSETSDDKETI